jgi:type II secretory pathway pseudopilin PulG
MKETRRYRQKGVFTVLSLAVLFLLLAATVTSQLQATGSDAARLSRADATATATVTPTITPTATDTPDSVPGTSSNYLPYVRKPGPTATPWPPPLPPPTPISAITPIDFEAARVELQAQDLDLAFNKIGFHTGVHGNLERRAALVAMMEELDAAGVPFFLKSVDDAEPLYIAQEIMNESGVPHTLVFRRATGGIYDVPNYNLPPEEAAQLHWQRHLEVFPPELDPELVWIETTNEVDKNRSQWLAEFALATAELALDQGYRWAAFGWSSGEPEPEHWQSPAMLEFLRLVAQHPDRLAIALHEYSYETEQISRYYPYLVGRFQHLFQVCDQYDIPRPTVMITEWGWEYQTVPEVEAAMEDIRWAAWLYAAYPQVKGAAIWYLGPSFGGIAEQAEKLIAPVGEYSLSHYFAIDPGTGRIDTSLFQPQPPTFLKERPPKPGRD